MKSFGFLEIKVRTQVSLKKKKNSPSHTFFLCAPRPCNQIVSLAWSAKSVVRRRAAAGLHKFSHQVPSLWAMSGFSQDIKGGSGQQQVLRGEGWHRCCREVLVSWRQPESGEVGEESTMFSSKPKDDDLLSTVEKSCGILFPSQVHSGLAVSSELCLHDGLFFPVGLLHTF